jgi:hypothetical protein
MEFQAWYTGKKKLEKILFMFRKLSIVNTLQTILLNTFLEKDLALMAGV